MPTLDWIGKQAVVNHHREVPTRLLHCDSKLSAGDPNAGNLLVEGDNLEALKALLPYYAGRVKCIYIDPPYNTGSEGWKYNDNVNSPEIRSWLGKVVGKELEDLSRHDKWLCMIYPRLRLLYDFLDEDGVLMCSISDIELPRLKLVLEAIFHSNNFIATFIWVNEGNIDNQSKIKFNHEYVICFVKREKLFKQGSIIDPNIDDDSKLTNDKISNTIVKNGPKNPVSDILIPAGFPASFDNGTILPNNDNAFWPKLSGPVTIKDGKTTAPVTLRSGWSSKSQLQLYIAAKFADLIDRKGQSTRFQITQSGAIYVEKDRSETQDHILTVLNNMGTVQEASRDLEGYGVDFDYPKPVRLVAYLIEALCRDEKALVMDSFAGSGTTGHAVLKLNRELGRKRNFVLIEMDASNARKVAAKRLEAVIAEEGLPGEGFRYCTLGNPLFDEWGVVTEGVGFADLAAFVFFSETGNPIPAKAQASSSLLGSFQDRAVHLLWSPDSVGVVSADAGNVLTPTILANLPKPGVDFAGTVVVYGEGCTVTPDRLAAAGVTFKQIPYQVIGA